ncbi:MAG: cyclic nucleotide-binding domain-containing protein [Ghiorsea sp.]
MSDLSPEEDANLRHCLAMHKEMFALYPRKPKYLQHQIEILLQLKEIEAAELLLDQLQILLRNSGLEEDARKAEHIRSHLSLKRHGSQYYSTPFLHLASGSWLSRLFKPKRHFNYNEGEYLIHFGEQETQMFIVLKGEFAVWGRDSLGKKQFMHILRAGEVIGELAFLDGTSRNADVIACKKSKVLAIPEKAILKLFLDNPKVEKTLRAEATTRKIQTDIKKNKAFSKLPHHLQRLLAAKGKYLHLQPVERLCESGKPIEYIDLICEGHIRLVGEHSDGTSLLLNSLSVGNLLGISAVLPHMEKVYSSDYVSVNEATLIRFPLRTFANIVDVNPRLYQALLHQAESARGSLMKTLHTQTNPTT